MIGYKFCHDLIYTSCWEYHVACTRTTVRNCSSWVFLYKCWRNYNYTVAHNRHGKTKSHDTANLTHGKIMLSDCKTKLTHGSTPLIDGKTKLTHGRILLIHGKTKLTHGKTKKTSRSAVVICFSNGMSCNSNTLLAQKPPFLVQCSLSRAHDVLQLLWFVSQSKCQLLQRLW